MMRNQTIYLLVLLFSLNAYTAGRNLVICIPPDSSPVIKAAAQKLLAARNSHPTLRALADGGKVLSRLYHTIDILKWPLDKRGKYSLLLVGMPNDPLIKMVWQQEAEITPKETFVFGYGYFHGTLGYIESDRNPFLHSPGIRKAGVETQVVTISGNSPEGVSLAVQSFLKYRYTNVLIAADGWTRTRPSLLDRDPVTLSQPLPSAIRPKINGWELIGITPAIQPEYLAIKNHLGIAPKRVYRTKYFATGAWDKTGQIGAFENYAAGLHRR
ncbi:MAG: hypothetical protein D6820_11060, partial [Lentisphaerae bacterium]